MEVQKRFHLNAYIMIYMHFDIVHETQTSFDFN